MINIKKNILEDVTSDIFSEKFLPAKPCKVEIECRKNHIFFVKIVKFQ